MIPSRVVATVVTAGAAVAYAVLSLLQFHQFRFTSWDNAIFEQAISGYSRFGAPIVDVKGPGFNILGDHFSPIYVLVAPFYRIWPDTRTVLLAQVALIALSVYVITAVAVRVCGTAWGAVVGVLYAVSFGLQSAVRVDFHEVAFAAPLLALAGAAYVERRWTAVVGWSVPLLLVKEDLGLTVAAIGGVLWLAGERRRGAWLAGIGGVGTVLAVAVVIPAFAADGAYPYASSVGLAPFDEPGRKLATLVLTFGITGLAALLSPWALIALPTLAWRFSGDVVHYWGTDWHYSLVLMPVVFVAAIDAVQRFEWSKLAIPVAVVVAGGTLIGSPLAELLDRDTWQDPPRLASAQRAVDAVPEEVSVETDIALLSHLVTDRTAYWYGSIGDSVTPDYIAFDLQAGIGSPADPVAYATDKYGGEWITVLDQDGYVVLRSSNR